MTFRTFSRYFNARHSFLDNFLHKFINYYLFNHEMIQVFFQEFRTHIKSFSFSENLSHISSRIISEKIIKKPATK